VTVLGPPNHRLAGRALVEQPRTPDPDRLAALLARAWAEIRSGARPAAQLAPHATPAVIRRLRACARRPLPRGPVRVLRIRSDRPSADACEVAVVLQHPARICAVVVRLERHRGRWRVVELTSPDDGLPALRTASMPHAGRPRDAFDEVFDEMGADDL
jgi:hypothetical protein